LGNRSGKLKRPVQLQKGGEEVIEKEEKLRTPRRGTSEKENQIFVHGLAETTLEEKKCFRIKLGRS